MNTTTIQISVYDWSIMEEIIYETHISNLGDFLALTYRYDKKVKYKKASDKNWYYAKTMVKRLFKNELGASGSIIKFVTSNDLNKLEEEKLKKKEEAKLKEEKEEQEREEWRKANPDYTFEQINSMSKNELANRLIDLYIKDYYCWKTSDDFYYGPFEYLSKEILHIENQLPPGILERAYNQAMEAL